MFLCLFNKNGNFRCEVKITNINSNKIFEWNGFSLVSSINRVNLFELEKQ